MSRVRRVAPVVGLGLALAVPATALAHPLGNFSINHHAGLHVSAEAIEVDLVIDMAEIPSVDALRAIDADGDGEASGGELDAARGPVCRDLAADLTLMVGGALPPLDLVAAGLHRRTGAEGLATLRIVCELHATPATPISVGSSVTFRDDTYAERIGWREIVLEGHDTSVSQRLTRYPEDLLQRPLDERAIDVVLTSLGAAGSWSAPDAWPLDAPSAADAPAVDEPDGAVAPGGAAGELPLGLDFTRLDLPLGLIGLVAASIAGAGHALSPGHGKTVMAAYLVGSRGRARHAVLLGAAVTLSHTLGVLVLAAVVLFAGELVRPEDLYPVLTVVSGSAVIVIGAALLAGCVRRWMRGGRSVHAHDHDHHHHEHGHGHEHSHAPRDPGWRGLAALGIAGGLVPSTSALLLLLAAIGAGQPGYGLALAVSFGMGMAAVLTGIGLAVVRGRGWLDRKGMSSARLRSVGAAVPWVTAIVVLAGGLAITTGSLATRL